MQRNTYLLANPINRLVSHIHLFACSSYLVQSYSSASPYCQTLVDLIIDLVLVTV